MQPGTFLPPDRWMPSGEGKNGLVANLDLFP